MPVCNLKTEGKCKGGKFVYLRYNQLSDHFVSLGMKAKRQISLKEEQRWLTVISNHLTEVGNKFLA